MDVAAGVTQEEGHTGFLMIQPLLSIVFHSLSTFFFFGEGKSQVV